ncbi:B12-binding domain-containing radical SAM protein [Geobacter sulfurreducens]|uniref:B12-binding domain-containing radical SAM protein n=1 Tax=Geobacter sulfurreducens TaxID=35554 RepID=UPI0020B8D1B3|nr:radical SAM protein [Geobacter sulfurreducens]UTG92334.1 radical SAM protein [Geobacter sulfurreducens]
MHAESNNATARLNYLLVMPRFVRNIGDSYGFPLGLAYVSSSLKKAGFSVTTLNLNHCGGTISDVLAATITENRISVVMTGGLSAEYSLVRSIVETVKTIDRSLITVVGGGIITSDPHIAMEALEFADIGVVGEGEITAVDLCDCLESGTSLAAVDGLIFRTDAPAIAAWAEQPALPDGRYITTLPRKEIDDIDSLPWPDYEGFELEKNLAASLGTIGCNETNTLAMITSRSCPYNCTFCFHTVGRKYRQRSLDRFFEELDYLVSRYKVQYLALSDELIARDLERLSEFCSRIKPYGIKWLGGFRVDDITAEMLPMLKDANCTTMGFGLESADNRILKSMRKGITVEQIEKTLKLVYDSGICISGGFIFGDIEETVETATNTLNWWENHQEYNLSLRLITTFPGTHLYKHACANGIIKDKVEFLRSGCPQINVSKMSDVQFNAFIKNMHDLVMSSNKNITANFSVYNINDEQGCVDISGTCVACGAHNTWEQIQLFRPTFITCSICRQQYQPPLNDSIRRNIDLNLTTLLDRYEKIAIWGMTAHAIEIFSNSDCLKNKRFFPVDICQSKQGDNFYGTKVFSPDVIQQESIQAVVVTAPYHISNISSLISHNYKSVVDIISVANLIGARPAHPDATRS